MMKRPLAYIHLSRFRDIYSKTVTVLLLLTLLSLSYVVEHSVLFEKNAKELLEGSEKEAEKKNKKLFPFALESTKSNSATDDLLHLQWAIFSALQGVDMEVQTPPPKWLFSHHKEALTI